MSDAFKKSAEEGDGFLLTGDPEYDFLKEFEQGHSSCDEGSEEEEEEEGEGSEEEEEEEEVKFLERGGDEGLPEEAEIRRLEGFVEDLQALLEVNTKMRDKLLLRQQQLAVALHETAEERSRLSGAGAGAGEASAGEEEAARSLLVRGFMIQFGMPYFKDADNFPCPPNEDYRAKVRRKELITHEVAASTWREEEMKLLEAGVKRCLRDEHREALRSNPSLEPVRAFEKRLEAAGLAAVLAGHRPDREFDWMKISALHVALHTPDECRKMWHLYAKPSLRRDKWSEEESSRLRRTAEVYAGQNWDVVAREMGGGRSPLQCFVHYRTRITTVKNSGRWTKEEDERLNTIVKDCMFGDFVHWPKVGYYMVDRSLNQIYNRWNNALAPHIKKGKFTAKEDREILTGILVHGLDPKEIAVRLGNRSTVQIRDRYTNQLRSQLQHKHGDWTVEEDRRLLELVNELGVSKWAKIAEEFKTRSRIQIRHRHRLLRRKMSEDPEFDVSRLRRWGRQGLIKKVKRTMRTVGGLQGKMQASLKKKGKRRQGRADYVESKRKTYKDVLEEEVRKLAEVAPPEEPGPSLRVERPLKTYARKRPTDGATAHSAS